MEVKNTLPMGIKIPLLLGFKSSVVSLKRAKAAPLTVCLFGVCLLIMFTFAMGTQELSKPPVALGVLWAMGEFLWLSIAQQLFQSEREQGMMEHILASGLPRFPFFIGKCVFTALYGLGVHGLTALLWALSCPPLGIDLQWPGLCGVFILFHGASAVLATFVKALVGSVGSREILLPILFLPLQLSILVSAVCSCLSLWSLSSPGAPSLGVWFTLMACIPVLFGSLAYLIQDTLFTE